VQGWAMTLDRSASRSTLQLYIVISTVL